MDHIDYPHKFDEWIKDIKNRMNSPEDFIGDHRYRHFDGRISHHELDTNQACVTECLKYPDTLTKHSFLPFIRRDQKVRRYSRNLNTGKTDIKQKLRPIMYASHKDACIYAFYSYLLKQLYERNIANTPLNESVLAYRRIERVEGTGRGKSNIDFAKEISSLVREKPKCAVLCLDVSQFFDSMDHKLIKSKWSELIGIDQLPSGHYAVYKNITKYRYAFYNDILIRLDFGYFKRGKFIYNHDRFKIGPFCSSLDYRTKIDSKSKSLIHKNKSGKGIPQGSPISDIIANMYMAKFDHAVLDYISKLSFGHYRRYSDDILIVCPIDKANAIYNFVQKQITYEELEIKPSKSEIVTIDNNQKEVHDITYSITGLAEHINSDRRAFQYLGFEIDADDMNIRSGTIANHYRRALKRAKAELENKDKKTTEGSGKNKRTKSNRSRWQYFINTENRTGSTRIVKQHKKAVKRVRTFPKLAQERRKNK